MGRSFVKMHGLGNDFVVIDARAAPVALAPAQVRAIADRHTGIGCDQLIVLEAAPGADAFMRVHNADGGEVSACGNGARCAAALLMAENGRDRVILDTAAGTRAACAAGDGITADMGAPGLEWRDIPLAEERDTLHVGLAAGALADPVAVNMGNPHAVFFVPDAEAVDLATLGPQLETDPLFPERTNVEAASVIDAGLLRMRVWERGAGITRACGTGACAALVAAHRRGLCGRRATVRLDGGDLAIEWSADNRVRMTGPAMVSFRGELDDALSP